MQFQQPWPSPDDLAGVSAKLAIHTAEIVGVKGFSRTGFPSSASYCL